MNDSINLKYSWNSDEAVSAYMANNAHVCRKPFEYAANMIAVLAIGGGIYRLVAFDWKFFPFALIAGGFYWLFFRRFDQAWSVRRKFKKRPDKDRIVNWVISENELHSSVEGLGESKIQWGAISKVVHAPNGFLIYPNDQIHYWLPHSCFSSEIEIKKLGDLAKKKVTKFIELA